MSLSMYQASVPALLRGLSNLSNIVQKGADDAKARNINETVYINDRIAPDMLPFSRQIQIACDGAVRGAARLAGVEIPSFPDVETTVEELQARIAKAADFIKSIPQDKFDDAADRTIVLNFPGREMTFRGVDFLQGFTLPNFYFHVTAAYLILRHNGVQLGKSDYLGG